MTAPIYPCIWFDGNAKEAAEFYCSVFSNSKITTENPMVVMFELCGKPVMGLNGGPQFTVNPSISFFILCETKEKTTEIWNKMAEGSKVMIPFGKQPWSELYGWLQDKYGVTWQIAINDKEAGKQTLTPSFLFTRDQFGRAEEAVKFYTSLFKNSGTDFMLHYPQGDANAGKVMYSEFNLGGYKLIAMDGPGEHGYSFNEGVSFVISCEDQKEIDYFWNHIIADGGAESMCGWCEDKFGVFWQVIPHNIDAIFGHPEKGQKSIQVMLKMKKLDIEKLMNP